MGAPHAPPDDQMPDEIDFSGGTRARLLREALPLRQVDELFTTMGKIASLKPQLTEAEINAKTAAARAERARCP
jgi:hypothetical protein